MASGWTNRGKLRVLQYAMRNESVPTTFNLALATSATAPTKLTNTFSQLTEIPAGNGYTSGGSAVARTTAGFDVATQSTSVDSGAGFVQAADVVYTATTAGSIPSSGTGARWAVLLNDSTNIGARDVLHYFDLVSARTVSAGQSLTIQDAQINIQESTA